MSSFLDPTFCPHQELQGVIFDCDGTLIDSMGAWLPSWVHACTKYGLVITEARFWGFAGVPLPDIVATLYADAHGGEQPSEAFVDEFLAEKRAFHNAHEAEAGHPPAIECVIARVRYYKARGLKVAVASSGLRDIVERCVERRERSCLLKLCRLHVVASRMACRHGCVLQ